jgi:hypothetical protein
MPSKVTWTICTYVNFSVFDLYLLFNQCPGSAEPWLGCDYTSSWQDCRFWWISLAGAVLLRLAMLYVLVLKFTL